MESNDIDQEYLEGSVPLGEPHFDEETTLLSARPVVPLQDIKAGERSRKRLIVGFAMACSLVLGALAGRVIFKQLGQTQTTAISTVAPGAAGIVVADPVSSPASGEVSGAATGKLPEAIATTVERKPEPSVSRSTAASAVESQPKKNLAPQVLAPQVEEPELTIDERMEARRLSRRLERQARRDSGGRQRKTSDELLRIRDIFEGPSRP